jgi:hypothetical protein
MPEISPQSLIAAVAYGRSPPRAGVPYPQRVHSPQQYPPQPTSGAPHQRVPGPGAGSGSGQPRPRAAAASANPWIAHYTRAAVVEAAGGHAQAGAGPVGALGYVSDAELAAYDQKVAGEAGAVDSAVAACHTLSLANQQSWQTTYAAWQAEHQKVQKALASSILGLGDAQMYAELQQLEGQILQMQDQVHGVCPSVIPSTGSPMSGNWATVVAIIAISAAAIAGFWFLSPVALALVGRSKPQANEEARQHER